MPDIPAYHSPGRCIYCMKEFPPEQLREEHIIPLALGGTWRIEHAACFPCQNGTNRLYENAALNSDMIRVPRALLELKRRRQKQKPPIWFPPLFASNTASATNVGHLPQKTVARDEYPALFAMIVMEPPGKLAPSYFPKRQLPRNKLRIWIRSIEENVPSAPIVSDEINFPGGYEQGTNDIDRHGFKPEGKAPRVAPAAAQCKSVRINAGKNRILFWCSRTRIGWFRWIEDARFASRRAKRRVQFRRQPGPRWKPNAAVFTSACISRQRGSIERNHSPICFISGSGL